MTKTNATLFCDYENMRWHAQRLFRRVSSRSRFDPYVFGQALCDQLCASGTQVDLAQVRVYRAGPPDQGYSADPPPLHQWENYHHESTEWQQKHGEQKVVEPLFREGEFATKVDWRNGQHKRVHTQLSVDLVNWAIHATRHPDSSHLAILSSADRDCAPAVREVRRQFELNAGNAHVEIAFAGWERPNAPRIEWDWLNGFATPKPSLHLLRWSAYKKRARGERAATQRP